MLSIDYFILEQIVAELAPQVSGASIAKIHQPDDDCLVFRLWNGRQNLKLLIQTGQGSRLHLTDQNIPNPFHPPRFSQLLRSRLKRLESISITGYDRVVEMNFSGTDQPYRLVCELLGARSNLYFLDASGLLLDALHKPLPFGNRLLKRGQLYTALVPPTRLNLMDIELAPPTDLVDADSFEKWLLDSVAPMSKTQAAALKESVELNQSICLTFKDFQQAWQAKNGSASIVELRGKKRLVGYLPSNLVSLTEAGQTLSQLLDHCFSPEGEVKVEVGERARYRQILSRQIVRMQKRQKNIAAQQDKTESFAERRQYGELLLANLHLVKKGMTSVDVQNWGIDPPQTVSIPLQQELSPQENAERFFKRYKKDKRGVEHVERRQVETLEELQWLEALLLSLDEATSLDEINEIGQELLGAGMIQLSKKEPISRNKISGEPRLNQILSPNGLQIYWGRNNRSNDHLSSRMTEREDLWFHAHNMPGCHVVLKRDSSIDFDSVDIEYAAQIAAGYSRGKDDSRVEVIVAEGRYVRRPKGAKLGLVTVSEYRCIFVEPLRIKDIEKVLES